MRLRILVLMGGPSSEHDVSVVSGVGVVRALDPKRYNVHPVFIGKDGFWTWSSRELSPYQKDNFSINYFQMLEGKSMLHKRAPALSDLPDCDMAFLALHGKWGEDGHIQALLEHWGIPYTGCGMLSSAMAMDKIVSKQMYQVYGIPTPAFRVVNKATFTGDQLVEAADSLGFPLVIKDPVGGSSLGMGIAKDLEDAGRICADLFQSSPRLLIEQFIAGQEASCGFIEGQPPLPPTEMRMTTREYFDFEAKYNGECQEITPAELAPELMQAIQSLAHQSHVALGCEGYSRTDVRIDSEGALWVLETNTLPGMTPSSLLPQQAQCIGLSYSQLIDVIIETSLKIKR